MPPSCRRLITVAAVVLPPLLAASLFLLLRSGQATLPFAAAPTDPPRPSLVPSPAAPARPETPQERKRRELAEKKQLIADMIRDQKRADAEHERAQREIKRLRAETEANVRELEANGTPLPAFVRDRLLASPAPEPPLELSLDMPKEVLEQRLQEEKAKLEAAKREEERAKAVGRMLDDVKRWRDGR